MIGCPEISLDEAFDLNLHYLCDSFLHCLGVHGNFEQIQNTPKE